MPRCCGIWRRKRRWQWLSIAGSKSLHGWFYCAGQPEERLRQVHALLRFVRRMTAQRGRRSQFVRMPDGLRDNGKRQVVYYFNPEVIK